MSQENTALQGGPTTFIKGKAYSRDYFGIDKTNSHSLHIVYGRFCLFLNMNDTFSNEEQKDGFIYEPRHKYALVPEGVKQPAVVSVFTRETSIGDYDYRGDSYAMVRYDDKRNKLLWG
jgi:hypothetical protein